MSASICVCVDWCARFRGTRGSKSTMRLVRERRPETAALPYALPRSCRRFLRRTTTGTIAPFECMKNASRKRCTLNAPLTEVIG